MSREYARSRRVGEQIQRTLSEILRRDLKDPRVGFASITAVEVSGDRETQPRFLVVDLWIGFLVLAGIRHRHRRAVEHVDRSAFPEPGGINILI